MHRVPRRAWWIAVLPALVAAGCARAPAPRVYEEVSVEPRDIVVAVSASGVIQPVLTLSVKSKASGEIIAMPVQTGDEVQRGQLLARIDPRIPKNDLTQAQASLDVAKAQFENASAQLRRSESLYESQSIAETDYEGAKLSFATARSAVVNAEANLQTAKDAMEDTQVRAPNAGTILSQEAVLGTVISSPTKDVGGGTVVLTMANLDTVQVQGLVDETDIGKVEPGMPVTITVDAYPNLPFTGNVLKIEPQAQVQQNVTMFPVLVNIFNRGHLLKPGMNAEVEVHVAERLQVLAVPSTALRTTSDMASAAQVLGLDPVQVQEDLQTRAAAADSTAVARAGAGAAGAAADSAAAGARPGARAGGTLRLPGGREIALPAGVSAAKAEAAMRKRRAGEALNAEEQALLRSVFAGAGGGAGGGTRGSRGVGAGGRGGAGGGGRSGRNAVFGGNYVVFVLRGGKPEAVAITTGVTDLDYTEVLSGLSSGDKVLILPSASLVQSQQAMRERFQRVTGGGGLPGMQQQQSGGGRAAGR